MSKLHELLAVQGSVKQQMLQCVADLANTFAKKTHHFTKKVVTFRPTQEGAEEKIESQLELQTTVAQELRWVGEKVASNVNIGYHIDLANTYAAADLVVGDETLATGVPATALMQLEKRVVELIAFLKVVPTLDPAKNFTPDPTLGVGIYKAAPDVRPRTQKTLRFITVAPATDKHPAQVKELSEDVLIGSVTSAEWSGLITVSQKGMMLDRAEQVLRAVKTARAIANEAAAPQEDRIGERIFNFITSAVEGAQLPTPAPKQ